MLDFDLEIEKMQPINIKNFEFTSYKIDEKIKKSIILYNTAIGEMKKNKLNLAIDDLKKALSYNKSFFEASKFIGLCYINIGEYRKAKKIFKKLAKNEMFKELAKEYLENIEFKQIVSKTSGDIVEVNHIYNEAINKKSTPIKGIILALSIIVIAIAGVYIDYFNPLNIKEALGKFQYGNEAISSDEKDNENLDENNSSPESEKKDSTYEKNEIPTKDLDSTKSNVNGNKDENNTINMISEAETYFNDGDYEKSANILISIRNMNLDNETKLKFDRLWQDISTSKVWSIYNDGNQLYKKGNYEEALPKIKIASEINPDLDIIPWATFQVGMCYKETKDYGNALIYFHKVIDNYPKSTYVSNAKMMISQIGN
ncbi:tetratricopeptide repeat protein [Clostridium sp. BL-8]|uniref:tetratricopeptide repeat protein n=1 Tax=Clostridium sp. BL-8 TaxID=349938 RepID=UPI00098CACD1|nr:tetratricopeptide repeat protein [Clostridium sp. BL-8]OOM78692.1 photosystem I assembly protein Ycf3 [Clostridium sp. BL-8]